MARACCSTDGAGMNAKSGAVQKVKRCSRGSHGWGDPYCTNPIDPKVSPHWCASCEAARRKHIDEQFAQLAGRFPT